MEYQAFADANDIHPWFMKRALDLARRGWGKTHPNPMVGAVIVYEGRIIAEGWHSKAGEAHAEVVALANLTGQPPAGAVLYVTLEPCCTHGLTGPCTQAILNSGIRHVVVGTIDPNPRHAGRGIQFLRDAGIDVLAGVLEAECRDLNLIFNHWITTRSPLFAIKYAASLDGKIACRNGDSKWITGPPARMDVHRWRRYFPAIATGSGTVLADNPALTCRLDAPEEGCSVRLILDRRLRLLDAMEQGRTFTVFTDAYRNRTVLVTSEALPEDRSGDRNRRLEEFSLKTGVKVWKLSLNDSGNQSEPAVFLKQLAERCVDEALSGVLFEGGSELMSALMQSRLAGYIFAWQGSLFIGDSAAAPVVDGLSPQSLAEVPYLTEVRHASFGHDHLTRGHLKWP